MSLSPPSSPVPSEKSEAPHSFLGHPPGLATLFGLELWERFSYLGFQAILALYFADAIAHGGLGYSQSTASSVVAAYGALVYLLAIAGAWVADRITGTYRAVLWGGVIIAAGHVFMGIPRESATWIGLGLIILGTGLLKPNVSTMVGQLYDKADRRRDAGFSIYYSGINIGAFLGPLVAGFLGQNYNWHYGFSVAAVGMFLGLTQYVLGRRRLAESSHTTPMKPRFHPGRHFYLVLTLVVLSILAGFIFGMQEKDGLAILVNIISAITAIVPIFFLGVIFFSEKVTSEERRNLGPYSLLLIALVLYNLLYFQTGNTLNFLALEHTRNSLAGFNYPSTWYISLTAIIEIALGPVLAGIWVKLGSRQPHAAAKVGLGAALGGAGFLIIAAGAWFSGGDVLIPALWMVACYVFLGVGDLVLQTSGMSATTKLAPRAFASQTMALWFAAMALAQGIQAQIVKMFDAAQAPLFFGSQGAVVVSYGVLLMLLSPWLRRRMTAIS
ncbi:MFS transporter [Corynebacterium sp. 3HC-13]|uniref:peptide MFS transporter n=1 Tax=Corynebacterium poyangense TaxID=2684405 RepID=UPI001CCD7281|nr:peptide MFS transporter [Corynebacterium poyangense]MBZ8176778.1 MFS transporter [Corynebacterium poyangense]